MLIVSAFPTAINQVSDWVLTHSPANHSLPFSSAPLVNENLRSVPKEMKTSDNSNKDYSFCSSAKVSKSFEKHF